MSAHPEPWDDGVADMLALVETARLDSAEPGWQEALQAVIRNCDNDQVLACAVKLLAELVTDLDWCNECFREWAFKAAART